MGIAADLSRVMAAGRPRLPAELQRLLTARVAWSLAVLLSAWGRGKNQMLDEAGDPPELDLGRYRDVVGAFDLFSGALLRLLLGVVDPLDAGDSVRLSGLGAQFAAVVDSIGPKTLIGLLNSPRYREVSDAITARYPVPAEVRDAFGEGLSSVVPATTVRNSRMRDYGRFDFPDRRTDENSPAFLRRQLDDARLSPELRMYYEQQLSFQGLSPYRSDEEARIVWGTILDGPMAPEVRDYFAANLDALSSDAEV